ncbi:MAG: hypothetical protein MHM6MM_002795 [Cercozoa sp. M6MM]
MNREVAISMQDVRGNLNKSKQLNDNDNDVDSMRGGGNVIKDADCCGIMKRDTAVMMWSIVLMLVGAGLFFVRTKGSAAYIGYSMQSSNVITLLVGLFGLVAVISDKRKVTKLVWIAFAILAVLWVAAAVLAFVNHLYVFGIPTIVLILFQCYMTLVAKKWSH